MESWLASTTPSLQVPTSARVEEGQAHSALQQAALICFEINIFTAVIDYWHTDLHPAVIPSIMIPVFFALNIWNVAFFGECYEKLQNYLAEWVNPGEAEFYLSFGKLLLIIGCLFYSKIHDPH